MFGGLGLQNQPYGYSVRNIFVDPFTEGGTGAGKFIFEGGFKFAASKERKKFNSSGRIGKRIRKREALSNRWKMIKNKQ